MIEEVKIQYGVIKANHEVRQVELNAFYEKQRCLSELRAFEEKLCKNAVRLQVNCFFSRYYGNIILRI